MEALAPALQGTAAAGAWGKTERRSWESDSLTHLGRRWSEEGWRRWWAEVAGYGRGGGAADLGKGASGGGDGCGGRELRGGPLYRPGEAVERAGQVTGW